VRCGPRLLALAALLAVSGCSLGGRMHLGDIWVEARHGLALAGDHVTLAVN
jgi:hypothetical protein